ncbi:putative O-acetyltransferase CAS1 [Psilocybe cubensis]|uniref:O-acetyltransferase CAS1 n=1 Tax=Psilocybe cubensis TaxID=181762 RepID=A0ACB8HGS5_PSICU|nr:putative O-acetyltransferase CAS1 [Psilocybe cubensis]KAH9487018.1 putative O-acetyltransferase CAS1 [Psilocybe cubensis]
MSSFKSTLNPAWPHFLGIFFILLACFSGITHLLFFGWADPMHCEALLNDGSWLDSDYQNWQPNGCMLYPYSEDEVAPCFQSREIIFIGDSVTRKLFFQTARTLDATLPSAPTDDTLKHADHTLQSQHATNLTFIWDPYLNNTYTQQVLAGTATTNSMRPAMLVLGSGLWYLRYANTSGGISAWESNMERIFDSLSTFSKPADEVIILPVEEVSVSKLSMDRALSIHHSDIDAMNSDLFHRINPPTDSSGHMFSVAPGGEVALPLVFNKMLDDSLTEDGLHYSDTVVKVQARILINLSCNDKLPKVFPLDRTCCNRYPLPSIPQLLFLFMVLALGPYLSYKAFTAGKYVRTALLGQQTLPPLIIGSSIALIYLADRTNFWQKEQKQFDPWGFSLLCLTSLALGLTTMQRGETDLGFLNRDQTEEWKGWMQLVILIYHYFRGSQISGIYNPVRVLVASYLFMTGYGHTTFYLRKADYGFLRIAQVLIRLNLFTILLAYTMNTDYISYYFTPLVSMWYIVVYATMAAGARFNDRTILLVGKILFSAAFMTWFMDKSWLLEGLFNILHDVFAIHWSSQEWAFRVNLDIWIVYVGMLSSVVIAKVREHRLVDHPRWPWAMKGSIGFSFLVLIWFFVFELFQESKFAYNSWHPYVSTLPVLAFVILRNSSVALRSASSRAFVFVGNCSLEAFIIQYHLWLAGDSKGILLVIPGTAWRPINFVITSGMFLYLCDRVSFATAEITATICGTRVREVELPATTPTQSSPETPLAADEQEIIISLSPLQADDTFKDESGNPLPVEPDTPIRPGRWVDRLAQNPSQPASHSFTQRLFAANTSWTIRLGVRILAFFVVLWLLNVFWPYPSDL